MLFCDTASGKANAFDDLVVFVAQLNAAGHPARAGFCAVPNDANRNHQFDIAPHLGPSHLQADESLMLIGTQEIDDHKLIQLRRTGAGPDTPCYAIGTFASPQAEIGAKAKLSYVLGKDPTLATLCATDDTSPTRCPVFGVQRPRTHRDKPVVLLIAPDLEHAHEARSLMSLAIARKMTVIVLTNGKTKQTWLSTHGNDVPFYHYAEALPTTLAPRVDVCATFADPSKSYRMQSLLANLAVQGSALIDCTKGHKHARTNDAFIAGPLDLVSLGTYLTTQILDLLPAIGKEVQESAFARSVDPAKVLAFLPAGRAASPAVQPSPSTPKGVQTPSTVVFMPTNGIGLGHAQRTSLIASALDTSLARPVFAAFPSCMQMLQNYGFDVMPLVSRSPFHAAEHANDLLNYARLRALTTTSKTFVFDGGYVFDSIVRSIFENNLSGVWVRRGLWQGTQDNSIALDREKAFSRVIVPMEAFDELNQRYSRGDHLREVGPIVQRTALSQEDRTALRADLAARYGRPFQHLVVTMLGGGVAADRKAQLSAICAMMDRRPDTLNLIVVWPTATVEAGCFAWDNTRVVKTHHASALVAAADLFISAVGYNSFHEAIYNQVPTIFIPQMAAMMDDQRARAIAAVDRGCASLVEPHEMLTLQQMITQHLDHGHAATVRANLAALSLPEPGNAQAARLIEEMIR